MADDTKKKGRDSEFVSTQEHEIAYLMTATKRPGKRCSRPSAKWGPPAGW